MNLTDLPRRKSGRRASLVPVPDPHQPATACFSHPAPVQFTDRRLAAIEQDLAWLRRVLERFTACDDSGAGLDPGSYGHPAWTEEPGVPAWHDAPGAPGFAGVPAADLTMPDQRAPMYRPYVPVPPLPPLPPVEADLDALPLFRAAVHAEIVRREQNARGGRGEGGTWRDRYAGLYESFWARVTAPPPLPDFRIAEMMAARFGTGAP